jgi:hypothetical protein
MRWLKRIGWALFIVVGLIQLVPYGRDHTNPPVVAEPAWDSPATRALAKRACFDCHSHDTVWPWYAAIAPVSWAVQHHVDDGREHLNFSRWDRPQKHADEMGEVVREGEMPMPMYLPLHPEARLTDGEKDALVRGLEKLAPPGGAKRADDDGDEHDDDD